MNPFWKFLFKNNFLKHLNLFRFLRDTDRSNYRKALDLFRLRLTLKRLLKDCILLTLGVASAGFGLKGFILPNNFIDGGAVGISLLIAELTPINLSTILILVSIPFIVLGWRSISREFAIKSAVGIVALAIVVAVVPYPEITHDKLLISVFGGFFLGLGIGFAVRGGGVIDGTEVLAINISKRLGMTIGDIILVFNIIIFSVAAYVFSIEIALYSILTYLSASKTVDFIIEGIEEYMGVIIVSSHANDIREMLANSMGRGFTTYKGERNYGSSGHTDDVTKIIFTVITRLEVGRLNLEIEKIDPNAFVVMHKIKDTKGGMIKKRPLSH